MLWIFSSKIGFGNVCSQCLMFSRVLTVSWCISDLCFLFLRCCLSVLLGRIVESVLSTVGTVNDILETLSRIFQNASRRMCAPPNLVNWAERYKTCLARITSRFRVWFDSFVTTIPMINLLFRVLGGSSFCTKHGDSRFSGRHSKHRYKNCSEISLNPCVPTQ